ncbi:MAG: hypothetical protein HY350_04545, partial [Candidatus Omnitrophica bacterium]|nr:hypothetical protein [Candidatus Omnitrophota bacterium]
INPRRISFEDTKRIIYGKPEKVKSQLNTSYATILNLYEKYREGLGKVYNLSLHYFQSKRNEQREAIRLIDSKLKLLKETGYIENGVLTQKGQFAKTVYGYELILSELYSSGILEELDEIGLGIVSAAVVFEPRKNQDIVNLSRLARHLMSTCEDAYEKIRYKELRAKIYPVSKKPYFHLSGCVESWMRGAGFDRILQTTGTDGGEIVRYFRMSIQILREINDANVSSDMLREKIKNAIRMINRDIVDAEKQLRTS